MVKKKYDIKNLPKWGQALVERQAIEIGELRQELDTRNGEPSPIYTHKFQEPKRYISEHDAIVFDTPTGNIRIILIDGCLRIQADHLLLVRPSAANSVSLVAE